ncbi:MAG: signal transduction histidine kinase, partial [Phenylobacterium sp.]
NRGLADLDPLTDTIKNYDVTDGLQSNEFNTGSYFQSASGELFFGGINGFNRFYPDNIHSNNLMPAPVLTDFLLANQSVPIATGQSSYSSNNATNNTSTRFTLTKAINALNQLTLNYRQNLMSFEFAALNFTNGMKSRYAYQLEGWDEDWIFTDAKNRRATYTNIPPGEYTLHIKAGSPNGDWNEQLKSLKIILLPPPWKTWWAYSIYAFLLSCVLFAFVWLLVKKARDEHALNIELEHKVAERTTQLVEKNREIVTTQQQLIHAEKMASLGLLTAGVAHEINNPTNFVQVSAQNLEVGLSRFQQFLFELVNDKSDESIRESFRTRLKPLYTQLSTIQDGAERIQSIVQDLRVFTQLDLAEQKTVRVTHLLQSTVNLVQTKYLKVTKIITNFEATPELYCSPAQLNQVFMNLIVNACDTIKLKQKQGEKSGQKKGQGEIIISCRLLEQEQVANNPAQQHIEISIQDNGCGMTDETKNKLFEPFFTTKDVGEGTGLGLSIAFGIVQKHGGELKVRTKVGVGSEFLLRLPL